MSPLVLARFEHIPLMPGSDWRDLPNIVVELSDGSKTKLLEYTHPLKTSSIKTKNDKRLRGVCTCALGKGHK